MSVCITYSGPREMTTRYSGSNNYNERDLTQVSIWCPASHGTLICLPYQGPGWCSGSLGSASTWSLYLAIIKWQIVWMFLAHMLLSVSVVNDLSENWGNKFILYCWHMVFEMRDLCKRKPFFWLTALKFQKHGVIHYLLNFWRAPTVIPSQ